MRLMAGLAALAAGAAQAADPAPAAAPTAANRAEIAGKWWAGFLAGSRLVSLPDGRRMNLYCEGKGAPLVVMDAGLGDGASSFAPVQDAIAAKTRVCAYDQAGFGASDPGPEPRDSAAIAGDLAALLKAAHERGPYVLVGHSAGSFNVRLFAFTHLKDVAGMVLIDPSADHQVERMGAAVPKMPGLMAQSSAQMKPCTQDPRPAAYEKVCSRPLPSGAPEAARAYVTAGAGPAYYRAMLAELDAFTTRDSAELETAAAKISREPLGKGALGARPLIILTAGQSLQPGLSADENAALRKVWVTMHDEMAGLSTRGVNRNVEGASHYVHQGKPQVVIDAVAEVVDAARSGRR